MEIVPSPTNSQRRTRRWLKAAALLACSVALIWGINYILVGRVVSQALDTDTRNTGYSIAAHYRYYFDPSTLVLDLREVSAASSLDLFRGLFESAASLSSADRGFDRVILARAGTPVYMIKGDDFRELGSEFSSGQNPVYLMRTLPEKLYRPTGEAAFGHWEGGILGVLGKQMEDVTEAGRGWAGTQ